MAKICQELQQVVMVSEPQYVDRNTDFFRFVTVAKIQPVDTVCVDIEHNSQVPSRYVELQRLIQNRLKQFAGSRIFAGTVFFSW